MLLLTTCNNVQAGAKSTAATIGITLLLTTCINVQAGTKSTAATSSIMLLLTTCNNVQAGAKSTAATIGITLLLTACNNMQAGAKSTAATSLKFQAEATAHLQNTGVGRTQDAPKYQDQDIEVRRANLYTRLVSSCIEGLESFHASSPNC